jgi:hypothetical protein
MDQLATLIANVTKRQVDCAQSIENVLALVKSLSLAQLGGLRGTVLGRFEVAQEKVADAVSALEELEERLALEQYC